jgi:uncharacterized protein
MNKYPDSSKQLAEPSSSVIPAKAGIQSYSLYRKSSGNPQLTGGSSDAWHAQQNVRYPLWLGSRSVVGESRNTDLREQHRPISLFAWPFLALIYIYRYSIGHWFAGSCRFSPSCSHYGEEALLKHGAWRGSTMTIKRLSRCHPWNAGGYDPVD